MNPLSYFMQKSNNTYASKSNKKNKIKQNIQMHYFSENLREKS